MNKEEQLLLEALCSELPYGLMMVDRDGRIYDLVGTDKLGVTLHYDEYGGIRPCSFEVLKKMEIKPIYRPLEDLTDEFIHDNIMDKPYLEIKRDQRDDSISVSYSSIGVPFVDEIINRGSTDHTPKHILRNLIKHHFNVHNLPEDQVIYTNQLANNPYE